MTYSGACTRTLGAPSLGDELLNVGRTPGVQQYQLRPSFFSRPTPLRRRKNIGQNRGLLSIGLWRRTFGFLAHDYVCGTPLRLYTLYPPSDVSGPYLATADSAVRYVIFSTFGVPRSKPPHQPHKLKVGDICATNGMLR
jgi:hypothetical protein